VSQSGTAPSLVSSPALSCATTGSAARTIKKGDYMNKGNFVLAISLVLTACESHRDEHNEKASELLKYAHFEVLQHIRDLEQKTPFATDWRDRDAIINVKNGTVCFGKVSIMDYVGDKKVDKLIGYKFSLKHGVVLDGEESDFHFFAVMDDCSKAIGTGIKGRDVTGS
jgi:hypothetical protein